MKNSAPNLVVVARRVGITYATLKDFRRLEGFPGPVSNGDWPVDRIRRFIASRAQRLQLSGVKLSDIEVARLRLVQAKIDLAEHRLAVTAGEVLPKETVYSHIDTGSLKVKGALYRFFGNELPQRCPVLQKDLAKWAHRRLREILSDCPLPFPA